MKEPQIKKSGCISACMIVKNEEAQLSNAISDLKEVADEVIVVDTGSQDNTMKIAKKMGVRLYQYKWDDHFGKARNFSFSKANYEWIFFIDADERLSRSLKTNLHNLVKVKEKIIYRFPIIDEMVVHTAGTNKGPVRLFRKKEFRFDENPRGHTQTYVHNCKIVNTSYPIIHCQRTNSILVHPEKVLQRVAIDVKDFPKDRSSFKFLAMAIISLISEFYRRMIKRKGYKDGILGLKWAIMRSSYYFLRYYFIALKPSFPDEWKQWTNEKRTQELIDNN
jgi:glycosyltransferase involved in cell wall biosynthesis